MFVNYGVCGRRLGLARDSSCPNTRAGSWEMRILGLCADHCPTTSVSYAACDAPNYHDGNQI